MKKSRIIKNFILIIIFSFIISACSFQKDVNVKSVEIIEETVPEFIVAGKFDEAGIEALVTYEDGTTETIDINTNLLKDAYQEQINKPGEYEIELLLKDKIVKLKVNIIEQTIVHEVRFFNGFNELVSLQMVKDGEDAEEPSGEAHILKGYDFIGWDRTFSNIKENINVYGIYTKISSVDGEEVNLENILLNSVDKMENEDVNVLYIQEISSKRVEQTYYHKNKQVSELVEKTTTEDREVIYNRYFKEMSSNATVTYFSEQYDDKYGYRKIEITDIEFFQNDIYGEVKQLVVSSDVVQVETMLSNNRNTYKLVLLKTNLGDENHVSDTYELVFDDEQVIYLKHYQNFASSSSELLDKQLIESKYFTINLEDKDKVKFPSITAVEDIAGKFLQGTITTQNTVLETEHFTFEIDSNVYVPGYLKEYIEIIYDALESVSGLEFYNEHYNHDKITIEVEKVRKDESPETEHAGAYAYSKGATIHVSSGDLLLGNSYAITHELSHILMYSQSSWTYSQVFVEGFAEYTSYKATKFLEENNMNVAKTLEDSKSHINNMDIRGNIYSKTIEYWIEHPEEALEISPNGAYAVGFRFMSYLDNIYEDYSAWTHYYEQKNPYYLNGGYTSQRTSLQEQYNAMEHTYGEAVLDGFYGWLKINEEILFADPLNENNNLYDMTTLEYSYIYPYFYYSGNRISMTKFYKFSYNNLYVGIDETRNYLQNYKNKDVSNLRLKLEHEVEVELYDSNNSLIETKIDDEFSLIGVSYIKLVGEGTLGLKYKHGLEILY